jgi:hypothetical protein
VKLRISHRPQLEDLFDSLVEHARNLHRQRKSRVVAPGLDRIDCLPRYAGAQAEFRLRPVHLGAKNAKPVLHRYMRATMAIECQA